MPSEATPDLNEVALLLARALHEASIPYAVGGAIAYGYWGAARGTKDVDLNVFVPAENPEGALAVLASARLRFELTAAVESARERGEVRAWHGDVPVDLFFNSIPLHESAARRAVEVTLLGRPIRILSAEDLTVFKLLFNRPKDLLDVERLVALRGGGLDRDYVREWLVDAVGASDTRVDYWDQLCRDLPA